MSEGFLSKSGQSYDSHHVLALSRPDTTSEPSFQGQQQTGHYFETRQAPNHQLLQRVVTNNGLQGAQWAQPQQQHFIVMQQPQQVIVSPKGVIGQSTPSQQPSGQFQLQPFQIQHHPSSSIDSQGPKVVYLIKSGSATGGSLPFQQVNLIRQSPDQNLRIQSFQGSQILQAQPVGQVDTTFCVQQQPHFQQMTLSSSPVHARRPPKQPRLVQTRSPRQGQMSQSQSDQNHGFVQHQLPRQIFIQGHVAPQQSQIIPTLSNSLPVPQQALDATGVSSFQDWTSSMTSSPVRFVLKTSVPQPFPVENLPTQPIQQSNENLHQTETTDQPMQNSSSSLPCTMIPIELKKKRTVPMSQWTPDYKNLVIEECLKHKILPALLANCHEVAIGDMRSLIKSKFSLLPRYKVNKPADLAKLTLKSFEVDPANYFEDGSQESVSDAIMECEITSSQEPSASTTTNQISVQTSALNDSIVEERNVPNTPQAPTNNLKGQSGAPEPGKLVLCKNCGCLGSDFVRCPRCKKPITKDCKIIADVGYGKSSTQSNKAMSPELILLSDDEEDDDTSSSIEGKSNANSTNRTEYFNPYEAYSAESESLDCESLIKSIEGIMNRENEPNVGKFFTRSVRIGINQSDLRSITFFTTSGIMLAFKNGEEVLDKVVIPNSSIQTVELSFQERIPNLRLGLKPIGAVKLRHQLRLPTPPVHDGKILICGREENSDAVTVISTIFNNRLNKIDWETMNNFDTLPGINFSQEKGFIANVKYCTYPQTTLESVSVFSKDYACLGRRCYLNDVIIDFYLKWLQHNELSATDRNRTHIFSSFFYNRLTMKNRHAKANQSPKEPRQIGAQRRYERVKRWTKNVNIFEKDFVIVPINENSHWFVAVICFPGLQKSVNFETGEPCMIPERQTWATRFADKRVTRTKLTKKQISKSKVIQIGSTSVFPLKSVKNVFCDENPDCDEASDSDEEFVNIDEEDLVEFCKEKFISSNQSDSQNLKVLIGQEKIPTEEAKDKPEENEEILKGPGQLDVQQISNLPNPISETQSIKEESTLEPTKPPPVKKPEKRIKQPCILILDSLSGTSRTRVAATLRGYLKCEYKAKMGQDREFNRRTMQACVPKIVQQPNTYDCGIFVLKYIECFFKKPLDDFCLPVKQCRNWFTLDEIKTKRSEIAKVIESLAKEQNPNNFFEYPDLTIIGEDSSDCSDGDEECSPKVKTLNPVTKDTTLSNVPSRVPERPSSSSMEKPDRTPDVIKTNNISSEKQTFVPGDIVANGTGHGVQNVDQTQILAGPSLNFSSGDSLQGQQNEGQPGVTSEMSDPPMDEVFQHPSSSEAYIFSDDQINFRDTSDTSSDFVSTKTSTTINDHVSSSGLNASNMVLSNDRFVMSDLDMNNISGGHEADLSSSKQEVVGLPSFSTLIVGDHPDSSSSCVEHQPLPSFSSINAEQSNSELNGFDMVNGTLANFESFNPSCSVPSFSSITTSGPLPNFTDTLKRGG